jgi:hypothetical protein
VCSVYSNAWFDTNQKGKEVITMNYAKPEIGQGESALAAIQSAPPKPLGSVYDSAVDLKIGTHNAYEADE